MGRHGAGQTSKGAARVSLPLVVIGGLVLAAIGFGIWLWSIRSVVDPIDAKPIDAYAVVVSSPSCTSGSGTTVIDLTLTPPVRSSLSACGRKAGERLAVEYLGGHPDQVRLAGTTIAHNSAAGRWLPIAILAAGLLAAVATMALLIERRQSRHTGAGARVTVAQLRAGMASSSMPVAGLPASSLAGGPAVVVTSVTRVDGAEHPAAQWVRPEESGEEVLAVNPDVTSRIAIPGFPGGAVHPFRPSEIDVDDDLFTHRGLEAPDR